MIMKRHRLFLLLLLPLTFSCGNRSRLETRGDLTLIHLEGTPRERGVALGELLGPAIGETLLAWEKEVEQELGMGLDSVLEVFFRETSIVESVKRLHPDLLEEVRGMAAATGLDYERLLGLQMSEEIFTLLGGDAGSNCTAIAYRGRANTLLAQNMDPPLFLHGNPLLMHILPAEGGPESFIFTVPGLLGMAGLNEEGLGICCNGISMLNHDSCGLPVVSVVRRFLAMEDLGEGLRFILSAPMAIPQCYTVGGPGTVRCFECSPAVRSEFYPFGNRDICLHTNHSINNRDFSKGYIALLARYGKTTEDPYFCPRYFRAYDEIESHERVLGREALESILRLPRPEKGPILNPNTLATLVMELAPVPVLHLATGHEEEAGFEVFTFK